MTSKLTSTGIDAPTLSQIQDENVVEIQNNILPEYTISNTDPTGTVITSVSGQESDLWDSLVAVCDQMNPFEASGTNLDYALLYIGIIRIAATQTLVYLLLTAATVTTFPISTSITAGGFTISNSSAFSITNTECTQAVYTVPTAIEDDTYSIILDGQELSYIAQSGDTTSTISAALVSLVNTDTDLFFAEQDGASFTVNKTTGGEIDYSVTFFAEEGSNVTLTNFSIYADFYNSVTGAYAIPSGTFDGATTGVSGVTCDQPDAGFTGNDAESDQNFRIRGYQSIGIMGATTKGAIQGILLATNYVQKAVVYSNNTDYATEVATGITLPANTVYAVVLGGYKVDVANAIYGKIGSGVSTYGATQVALTTGTYPDSTVNIYFDYATEIPITLSMTITLQSSQWYQLSPTAQASVMSALQDSIDALNIGETMFIEQLIVTVGTVISSGVENVAVEYTIKPSPTTYTTDLSVDGDAVITIQPSDITVTILSAA